MTTQKRSTKRKTPEPGTRERLVTLRDQLTAQMESAPPAYVAGIARQLQACLLALDELIDPDNVDGLVERLAAERKARLQAARRVLDDDPPAVA